MKSTINNKVLFLSILFGGLCTSLYSQTNEKIEKVKPKEILNLVSYIEDKTTIKESKHYKTYCYAHKAVIINNNEESTSSEFNLMRRGEVSRLASRNLYDMVMIIK